MAQRNPKVSTPIAPEAPCEPVGHGYPQISSHDEWEDHRLLDADFAAHVAERVQLTRCELHRVVLTGAQLRGIGLVDVRVTDCELSGAYLHEARLHRVEFRNCRMAGVVLSQSNLNNVRFVECKLDGGNLRLAQADHLEMSDCSVVDADFYEAVLTQSALTACDLRASDFSKASVKGLRLAGSKLDGVRGAMSMAGVVVAGDQVLPLALGLFAELRIDIDNDEA